MLAPCVANSTGRQHVTERTHYDRVMMHVCKLLVEAVCPERAVASGMPSKDNVSNSKATMLTSTLPVKQQLHYFVLCFELCHCHSNMSCAMHVLQHCLHGAYADSGVIACLASMTVFLIRRAVRAMFASAVSSSMSCGSITFFLGSAQQHRYVTYLVSMYCFASCTH